MLCYIFLLHQTTTNTWLNTANWQLCYIFLLHQTTTINDYRTKEFKLCYIFLLHQTTTRGTVWYRPFGCVISFFYIKPQPERCDDWKKWVVLYLSSTSNHNLSWNRIRHRCVVLYLSSTSNHNRCGTPHKLDFVVLYLSSTSNHNLLDYLGYQFVLCYIFLLHQTTTTARGGSRYIELCYIFLLHQTTTNLFRWISLTCCVISFFYIKPQLFDQLHHSCISCVISFFYIKPQPYWQIIKDYYGCVISFFYIKPQPVISA